MSQQAVVHAYRHLLRQSLRAIQFSKPARFTLRNRLRLAFRRGDAADFDQQKINNTLEFLRYATVENGLEHKIVKNLLFVWWHEAEGIHKKIGKKPVTLQEAEINITAYDTFNHQIRMLNESMGMCLPAMIIRGRT
ncbi:DUF1763-domain-containing protein [Westerdykella ornata]|uniref:DUF1763-domain-containing protein n=1 Tax=Westerdykella ornata TaxID=318751 RepID=A0A6A6JGK3_WESOR|nr:DUF1763-domain-containing protein [Westerdykella ornata]KAF2275552.1 DUF1763-domain-containing protein [Westerdykella ornata]